MNPNRFLITGLICGHRVETIEDPFMREVRHLDKLVDEVAKARRWKRCFGRGDPACRLGPILELGSMAAFDPLQPFGRWPQERR